MPSKTRAMVRNSLQRDGWTDGAKRQGLARKLSQVAAKYLYDSTSKDGKRLTRDDGQDRNGRGIDDDRHLDARAQQGGSAEYGRRMSAGGGAGREENPTPHNHIDHKRNRREWPAGAELDNRNLKQRTGVRGGVVNTPGNWYSGGKGNSRG